MRQAIYAPEAVVHRFTTLAARRSYVETLHRRLEFCLVSFDVASGWKSRKKRSFNPTALCAGEDAMMRTIFAAR
jgi:hypothetical protein